MTLFLFFTPRHQDRVPLRRAMTAIKQAEDNMMERLRFFFGAFHTGRFYWGDRHGGHCPGVTLRTLVVA